MKVLDLRPGERVLWQVTDGPPEWIDTRVSFELKHEGEYAIALFKHLGWKEPGEFMHHCSTKWAAFLMSLKAVVETGKGRPARTKSRPATGTESATRDRPQRFGRICKLHGATSGCPRVGRARPEIGPRTQNCDGQAACVTTVAQSGTLIA
jgi:hypothetical protein